MTIRIASVVELGSPDLATVLGIHPYVAEVMEELVMAKGQHFYGRFRLTRTDDNRIMIEKDFLPVATEPSLESIFKNFMGDAWEEAE